MISLALTAHLANARYILLRCHRFGLSIFEYDHGNPKQAESNRAAALARAESFAAHSG
jgi:hypothetical protein